MKGRLVRASMSRQSVLSIIDIVSSFKSRQSPDGPCGWPGCVRSALALLQRREVLLAVQRYAAQVIQLGRHARGYDATLLYLIGLGVGIYLPLEP